MKNRVAGDLSIEEPPSSHAGELKSMKPGIPWSVKGVEPELREIAKTAARRSGMTLGEWLNSAINEQADGAASENASAPDKVIAGRISTHPIERAATRLEDIAEQLSRLAMRETETAPRYVSPPQEENGNFARILSRVESNERQTVEAFTAVNERLALLGRQFQRAQPVVAPKPEESPGFVALEKAVRNIVEHLEVSEKRTRDNLKSLQDRIGDMSTRASNTQNEQVLRQAPAFSALENRLSELAQRIDQNQNQPAQGLPDLLRRELDELAGRIETVRDSAESLAQKAQTQAVQASQAELRVIEQRILGLLREAQTSMVASSNSPAEIQRFRGEIEKLNTRIDETGKGVASDRDVTALRVAVEQLSTRVAQGADPRPLVDMDRRLLDLTQKLEQTQAQTREIPQLNELERRMAELDHRLEHALNTPSAAPQQSDDLVHHLAVVNDRLSKTEHQLSHLETIERAIAQLYDSMEQNRDWTKQVAEDAATRMGQQVMSQQPQGVASLGGSPEIMALEEGLKAVREASQGADHRNQETLEAVHETLEQIVAKLSELETAAIGQRVAQAAAPTVAPIISASAPDPFHVSDADEMPTAAAFAAPQIEPEEILPEPSANPFEAAPSAGFAGYNPFDAAAKTTADASVTPAAPDDFIAAARKAAQAANGAHKGNILSGLTPGAAKKIDKAAKKTLSFKMPFKKGPKADKATILAGDLKVPPEIKPANSNQMGTRRTLILSGLVALTMVAFFVSKNLGGNQTAIPAATPAVVEQPAAPAITAPAPAAIVPAPDAAPAAQPIPQAVQPAPLEATPPAVQQRSDSSTTTEPDTILTGSLPAASAPKPASIDLAIGNDSLRRSALTGDANAQFVVATRYLNGENVPPDAAKAAYWYGRAAVTGLAPAQYRMATLYERGTGVERNMQAALSWYERAAALGNVKAMHNAAVISAGNDAGNPDYARAFKWFTLAANHGLKDSEFNLAVLIERGMGTTVNLPEALFWYKAAGAQGDTDAQTHAEALAKSLPPATVQSIEARLKTWVPDKAPDVANVVAINDTSWKGADSAPEQTAAAEPSPVNLIGKAQGLLDKLGYNIGTADGKLGGRTSNAVRLFQLQQGMKVTGQITPELIEAMESKTG
jgi:localization factor PodJL